MNEIIFWSGIWPNWQTRPIGTYQLSYWLRSKNIECQVIDFCQWLTSDEIIELTVKFIDSKTKYIGITSSFWDSDQIPKNIMESILKIKKLYPQLKIIIGGARADSASIKKVADITMVGEAEDNLLSLIKGHNLSQKFDITKLNHRFSKKDCIIDNEVLPIELGRGCIFKCKFCAFTNLGKAKHTYQRPMKNIEDEIIYNFENFKTVKYLFLDDTVNEDIEKLKNLSLVPSNTGVDINWNGYLRADLLWRYKDSPELLLKSGLRSCFFGIETFNSTAALSIGKGWNAKHGKEFLKILYHDIWNQEVNIWNNFIAGLPGEDKDSILETVEWCLENPMGTHRFLPLNLYHKRTDTGPKSEFTKNYAKYGYKINNNGTWSNEFFTEDSCKSLVNEINRKLIPKNKLSSWMLFDFLNSYNDIKKAKTFPENFHNKNEILFRKNFLNLYIEKLKNL